MDAQLMTNFLLNHAITIVITIFSVLILLCAAMIGLILKFSGMQSRYRKMMRGATGKELEKTLLRYAEDVAQVERDHLELRKETKRMDDLLQKSLTRVSVVRFRAFEDMGSDLSYAVALLDSDNNGVVFSSIFGREDSRSYAKPIEGGRSSYTLSTEEEQALSDAMRGA